MLIVWCKDVLRFQSLDEKSFRKAQEQWGELTLQQEEGQTLQQQIYTAFHRGETMIG
jgi:hypothetical protein